MLDRIAFSQIQLVGRRGFQGISGRDFWSLQLLRHRLTGFIL